MVATRGRFDVPLTETLKDGSVKATATPVIRFPGQWALWEGHHDHLEEEPTVRVDLLGHPNPRKATPMKISDLVQNRVASLKDLCGRSRRTEHAEKGDLAGSRRPLHQLHLKAAALLNQRSGTPQS